jgi:hypothetical protein
MKITGLTGKFGWLRTAKTRFLTLLRPEHFEGVSIAEFDDRLNAFDAISSEVLLRLSEVVFSPYGQANEDTVKKVFGNILRRKEYVAKYFRTMCQSAEDTKRDSKDTDYSAFGQSFMDMHNKKK